MSSSDSDTTTSSSESSSSSSSRDISTSGASSDSGSEVISSPSNSRLSPESEMQKMAHQMTQLGKMLLKTAEYYQTSPHVTFIGQNQCAVGTPVNEIGKQLGSTTHSTTPHRKITS